MTDPVSIGVVAVGAAGLSKPLTKLIDAFASMVGAGFRPLQIILNEHAQGRAALVRERYARQLEELRSSYRLPSAVPSTATLVTAAASPQNAIAVEPQSEPAAAQLMATYQQQKRYGNVLTIVAEAADQLPGNVSDVPVDDDWVARFFSNAQDVSSEELQRLWGQLLAREVTAPGAVPLRTLDTLRNLSRSEALLVERFASMIDLQGGHIRIGNVGITQKERAILVDCGIVDSGDLLVGWTPDSADKADHDSPGYAMVVYPSGHSLVIRTKRMFYMLSVCVVRPSARALIAALGRSTDYQHLQALVEGIRADQAFNGTVELVSPKGNE